MSSLSTSAFIVEKYLLVAKLDVSMTVESLTSF